MTDVIELVLSISEPEADAERLDFAARRLLQELRQLPLESAALASEATLPAGAKGLDPVTGAIVVTVLPSLLPQLTEFLQTWVLQGRGRQIKFKGKIRGHLVDYEGSLAELKELLALLEGEKPKSRKTKSK